MCDEITNGGARDHGPTRLRSRWAGAQATTGTTTTVDAATLRKAVLPVTRGGPHQQSFTATDATRRERPTTTPVDETVVLPVKAQPTPSMSLEQYAALWAELAVFPVQAATLRTRYSLADAGARKALEEVFARQPAFARQHDVTIPLSRSVLLAARARGPAPFPPPVAPVIRERPGPAEDDEDPRGDSRSGEVTHTTSGPAHRRAPA